MAKEKIDLKRLKPISNEFNDSINSIRYNLNYSEFPDYGALIALAKFNCDSAIRRINYYMNNNTLIGKAMTGEQQLAFNMQCAKEKAKIQRSTDIIIDTITEKFFDKVAKGKNIIVAEHIITFMKKQNFITIFGFEKSEEYFGDLYNMIMSTNYIVDRAIIQSA